MNSLAPRQGNTRHGLGTAPLEEIVGQSLMGFTRLYFGHHKCASQYIKTVLRRNALLMGWSIKVDGIATELPMGYHLREPFAKRLLAKREWLAGGDYDLICLENADNDSLSIIEANRHYRGFHVIRDPRDIVVSGYFSHRYSHPVGEHESPWLWEYRQVLEALPDVESGLLAEIEFCTTYFARLYEWDYANPNILEIRYESLIANPYKAFAHAYQFMDVPIRDLAPHLVAGLFLNAASYKLFKQPGHKYMSLPAAMLRHVLKRHSFARKSGGRRQGIEDPTHHYRKGEAGDWRNYFTPKVKDAFKQQYPGLLETLRYESDEGW